MKYAIVPIDKIPKQEEIVSPPKNLVQLYNFGADMVSLCLLHEGVGLAAGQELKATGSTLHLEPVDQIFEGFEAVVYQHEIEHQRGILISDVGEEMIVRKGL